jgi:hypothetical protein
MLPTSRLPGYACSSIEENFERDLTFCSEFEPTADSKRPVVARFRGSVARRLSPLM